MTKGHDAAIRAAAGRKRAQSLAKSDTESALSAARDIEDPFYRVQALTWIAHFASVGRFRRICDEARSSRTLVVGRYKYAVCSAWLIRTMIDHNHGEPAEEELAQLLNRTGDIEHPVSRLEAAHILFKRRVSFGLGAATRVARIDRGCAVRAKLEIRRSSS